MPIYEEIFLKEMSPFIKIGLTGKKLALDFDQGRSYLFVTEEKCKPVSLSKIEI